jgi:heme O synthase-like polyprenyltransferase
VSEPNRRPTWRERTRPAEVLGLAAVLSAFVGVGVLFSTRNLTLSFVFFGAAFVVSVLVFATLLLAISKPETPPHDDDRPSGH